MLKWLVAHPLIGGGLLVGLFALLKSALSQAWHWLLSRILFEVQIDDDSDAYEWITEALAQYDKKPRLVTMFSRRPRPSEEDAGLADPVIGYHPGDGTHFYRFATGFLWASYSTQKSETRYGSTRRDKSLILRTWRLPPTFAIELAQQGRALQNDNEYVTPVYYWEDGCWDRGREVRSRHIESVILPTGTMESLLKDMLAFQHERMWYLERGIPHRRGYLLHGPPGNGKSSLALALASALDRDVYVLNVGSTGMSDLNIRAALARVPLRALVLIEDIDGAFSAQRQQLNEDSGRRGLTLSGILNALDGVEAADGRILLMTTNRPQLLDEALTRPGRVDVRLELGNATPEQARRLLERFWPDVPDHLVSRFELLADGRHSMAYLQEWLLQRRHVLAGALENLTGPEEDVIVCENERISEAEDYSIISDADL